APGVLGGSGGAVPFPYELLRAPSADADLAPVSPQISDTALTDSNLENDRDYFYAVRAVRTAGGTTLYGRPSARVVATPRDVTPPSPPANPVGVASEGGVRLSWSPIPQPDGATYAIHAPPE